MEPATVQACRSAPCVLRRGARAPPPDERTPEIAPLMAKLSRRQSLRLRRWRYPIAVCALVFLARALTLHDAPLWDAGSSAILARAPHSAAAYAERVRTATAKNFDAYWRVCRGGGDEYEPALETCHQWFKMGLTAVDSIDTLILMRLSKQYQRVLRWAEKDLTIRSNNETVSFFELVIRSLGGFNSAFALTGDEVWRTRAKELADSFMYVFNFSSTGCPPTEVKLNADEAEIHLHGEASSSFVSTSETGTMQLELRTLSQITGLPHYAAAADRCIGNMVEALPDNRVVPQTFNSDPLTIEEGFDTGGLETIGAHVDSFIEMLLKTWIWSGKRDGLLRVAFERQVELVFQELSFVRNGTLGLGVNDDPNDNAHIAPTPIMEHLACYFPGVLALGALHGLGGGLHGKSEHDYIHRARDLTRTCYLMSRSNEHGLAPEISSVMLNGSLIPKDGADHSLLRPEVIEAVYIMHEVTGDPMYREWGKEMWDDIQRSGTLENGLLTSSFEMRTGTLKKYGKLHSFVLGKYCIVFRLLLWALTNIRIAAETLKYFYLLFRDRGDGPSIDLENWVFNTEAHPVRVLNITR